MDHEFTKLVATDDHPELMEAAGGQLTQFFDRSDPITKSASDAIMRDDIARLMPPDTHFGVHAISMGAEEDYGFNRNADSASRKSLMAYHPSFEKFGHIYREHNNKCPKTQSVGQIKLARYNERMNRGELFFWVEKDKAPDMYKAAKAGKELSWSMSMKLPYDRCSICDKKSRNRGEYCGCLKKNLGKYVEPMRKFAYARNEDDVKFFDMSEVKRRADRIATYLSYTFADNDMRKAASADDLVISGAEWFDFERGNANILPLSAWDSVMLHKLASTERELQGEMPAVRNTLAAAAPDFRAHLVGLRNMDIRNLTGELAKRAAILDFLSFTSLITGVPVADLEKDAGCMAAKESLLPTIFSDMEEAGGSLSDETTDMATTPDSCGCSLTGNKDVIDDLMKEESESLSLNPDMAKGRMMKVEVVKVAAHLQKSAATVDSYNKTLAHIYARYVVKAARMAGIDSSPLSLRMLVAMNLA
jgi:hypothetical protein